MIYFHFFSSSMSDCFKGVDAEIKFIKNEKGWVAYCEFVSCGIKIIFPGSINVAKSFHSLYSGNIFLLAMM